MRYNPEEGFDYMPPNDPWKSHSPSEDSKSYLIVYWSEDEISKYPVREVTKVNDNKSDPNLETMSYGLCSTCTTDNRRALVKENRPYIFFCTNFQGERYLTGYYHIGWYSQGPPIISNMRNGNILDDYRLVADEMKFVYPPFSFEEIAERCDFESINSGFRKKLVSPEVTDRILELFDDRKDASEEYIDEIRRLERVNKRYHGYRYPTWEREEGFSWDNVEQYVKTENAWSNEEIEEAMEEKLSELDVDLGSISFEDASNWHCLVCDYVYENEAPLKLCPNCNNGGGIIPAQAIQS